MTDIIDGAERRELMERHIADTQCRVLAHYADGNQTVVAVEELSELQKELCKSLRGEDRRREITEEIADVMFMLPQLCEIYGIDEQDIIETQFLKAIRLDARMTKEDKEDKKTLKFFCPSCGAKIKEAAE